MKKILFSFLALPIVANAAEAPMEPFSGSGLQIIPLAEQRIPESLKLKTQNQKLEMQKNGFHQIQKNTYAEFLLNLKMNANDEIRAYRNNQDIYDSHLKKTLKEVKLAFPLKKLPIDDKNVIGYAPVGSYIKSPEGWNGIKVFFEDKEIGTCAYEFIDLNLSHGGIQLVKEYIQYIVDDKPSATVVEGNYSSGFTYSVVWYDGIKVNTIDCAQNHYSAKTLVKVIGLANMIDKST